MKIQSLPIAIAICLLRSAFVFAADQPAENERFFETQVRPLLVKHCLECHGAKKQQGSLRLDSRQFLLKGNETGPAVVPGKPESSRFLEVLKYSDDDTQMPPKGKLPAKDIAIFTEWIRQGVFWPARLKPSADHPAAATNAWKKHWAFQPVTKPNLPAVKNRDRVKSPIDHFILAELENRKMVSAGPADRATLARRVSFDLIGLPPTYEQVQAFVKASSPQAYENFVDSLLARPQFGERWGRHWLDVARYADTKGYVFREDRNYPDAYRYREWVINALNADMPYDKFLIYQLAADQVIAENENHHLHAMGFLTLGRRFLNNIHDIIDDRIDVVSRGTMAVTVSCARCHDHKYDPFSIADYYSLYGVFFSSNEPKNEPSTLRLEDKPKPVNVQVFLRGSSRNRGKAVPRQFLPALSGENPKPFEKGSGRLELAQAIASSKNPLTARVFANRVWGHLFGNPLVKTPSDFGLRSDPPSHPELLDYLASTFVEHGWSVKKLIREIVLSGVYRQASFSTADYSDHDPENRLLSRMSRRRLDFESQRDSILFVAGQLDQSKIGGPSVKLTATPFPKRRTVYAFIDRQNLPGVFRTFDFASPDTHSPQRFETTVPQQSLFLMNHEFVMQLADVLANRTKPTDSAEEKITQIYRHVFSRDPQPAEIQIGVQFLKASQQNPQASVLGSAWSFGYGAIDETNGTVTGFQRLPHWTGSVWQGGLKLPDEKIGWAFLNSKGGHPGNDRQHAAIRRWTAPADGVLSISGQLKHPSDKGDGVRGTIISSRSGKVSEWISQKNQTATRVEKLAVKRGDTIDFTTDCRTSPSFDSFEWRVNLKFNSADKSSKTWDSVSGFHGPLPKPLTAWGRYAQVLLLSNEFTFVD